MIIEPNSYSCCRGVCTSCNASELSNSHCCAVSQITPGTVQLPKGGLVLGFEMKNMLKAQVLWEGPKRWVFKTTLEHKHICYSVTSKSVFSLKKKKKRFFFSNCNYIWVKFFTRYTQALFSVTKFSNILWTVCSDGVYCCFQFFVQSLFC